MSDAAEHSNTLTPRAVYAFGTIPEREHANPLEPLDDKRLASVLGNNVEALRRMHGLTKMKLSLMTRISRPLLNKIINGTADIKLSYIVRLADALGVQPQELLKPNEWYISSHRAYPMAKRIDLRDSSIL